MGERVPGKLLSPAFRVRLAEFFDTQVELIDAAFECDDLVQDVYLRLLTRQQGVRLVANEVLKSHSAIECRHVVERYDESRHGRAAADPQSLLLNAEAVEQAVAIVMQLPQRMREIWVLRYLEELTQAEIAEELEMDESTARKYLGLARDYLTKHFG